MIKGIGLIYCFLLCMQSLFAQNSTREILYVGTFSVRGSAGIYVLEFNRFAKSFRILQSLAHGKSPSFLAFDPQQKYIYAAYRQGDPVQAAQGSVAAYRIDPANGHLHYLNQQPTLGAEPCHVSVHPNGKLVFVSNYQGGSVVVYPLNADGSLAPASDSAQHLGSSLHPERQTAPHAHSAIPSRDGKWLYVSDLGLDRIMVYQIDLAKGKLSLADQPFAKATPGSGPRHLIVHPRKPWIYSLEELSSTLQVYRQNRKTGALLPTQGINILPALFDGPSKAADLHFSSDLRYLYASNRGHDQIGVFQIHRKTGLLSQVQHHSSEGKDPRNFCIDQLGRFMFVCNQNSDEITAFLLDEDSGNILSPQTTFSIPSPVCLLQCFLSK
jgi:6-phosphogluconolactonase